MSSIKDGAQRLYSKKNIVRYVRFDHNSPYLIVNTVVSYPPPQQRERGGVGKISPLGWEHLYMSANFQNQFFM
jgi:hypothetical protein